MKRVIYNLNSIRPPITGIGRYAIELLRGGIDSNLPVSVAHNGDIFEQQSLLGLLKQLENTQKPSSEKWRQLGGRVPFSRELYRRLDSSRFARLIKSKIDTGAIFHDINYSASPQATTNVSTVYDLSHRHSPGTHPLHRVRFLKRYFAGLVASDNHIITISDSIKQELVNAYNLEPDRIHVTHLAADQEFRPRSQAECQLQLNLYGLGYKQYVLSVGTLEPRKNLARVLAAYCALDATVQRSFPLVIAGPKGWKSRKLEGQIDQLQKQGLVIKIGFVPQHQLPALYASAVAFVYPSLYEGFGLPLLEAMQSGCPCITSNSGALAEVSDNHALEVDPLDVDNLALNLTLLLQDSKLNSHYSLAGLARSGHFSWAKTVAKTHRIYDAI